MLDSIQPFHHRTAVKIAVLVDQQREMEVHFVFNAQVDRIWMYLQINVKNARLDPLQKWVLVVM
jgi:hypothetical protein